MPVNFVLACFDVSANLYLIFTFFRVMTPRLRVMASLILDVSTNENKDNTLFRKVGFCSPSDAASQHTRNM